MEAEAEPGTSIDAAEADEEAVAVVVAVAAALELERDAVGVVGRMGPETTGLGGVGDGARGRTMLSDARGYSVVSDAGTDADAATGMEVGADAEGWSRGSVIAWMLAMTLGGIEEPEMEPREPMKTEVGEKEGGGAGGHCSAEAFKKQLVAGGARYRLRRLWSSSMGDMCRRYTAKKELRARRKGPGVTHWRIMSWSDCKERGSVAEVGDASGVEEEDDDDDNDDEDDDVDEVV